MDRMRALASPTEPPLLGIAQLEENVIELRASRNAFRHVYLSGARLDAELGPVVVEQVVDCIARCGELDVGTAIRAFWRRVLSDALRLPHGTLAAVAVNDEAARARFADASHLSPPIDVAAHVRAYLDRHDEKSRANLQGLAALVSRMLRADGITVLGVDGAILAFNAFIAHRSVASSTGGARRRTYETLASEVAEGGLVAAFYHSQDGGSSMKARLL
jgi:hypothetical protein